MFSYIADYVSRKSYGCNHFRRNGIRREQREPDETQGNRQRTQEWRRMEVEKSTAHHADDKIGDGPPGTSFGLMDVAKAI